MTLLTDFREPFVAEGEWWLPENPDERLSGTLTFNQDDGAQLSLVGAFGGFHGALARSMASREVIHGVTIAGKRITLFDAFVISRNASFSGTSKEVYTAHWLLIGYHSSDIEEEIYSSSYSRFDGLEAWLGHRLFTEVRDAGPEFPYRMEQIEHRVLQSMDEFEIGAGLEATVDPGDGNELTAKSQSFIKLNPITPKSLRWHFDRASELQSLAILCTGKFLPFSALRVKGPQEQRSAKRTITPDIDVLIQMVDGSARLDKRRPLAIIPIDVVQSHCRDAISRWYSALNEIELAVDLYRSAISTVETFANTRLLLSIQALEVYHRRTSSGGAVSSEDHEKITKALTGAIPADLSTDARKHVLRKLDYINEPSLGQRLKALIRPLKSEFGRAPVGFSKEYISKVVDTRNYNTHFDPAARSKSLHDAEMHWATRRSAALFTIIMLRHIGTPDNVIHGMLKEHGDFQHLLTTVGVPNL